MQHILNPAKENRLQSILKPVTLSSINLYPLSTVDSSTPEEVAEDNHTGSKGSIHGDKESAAEKAEEHWQRAVAPRANLQG
jgi:hypothetical protein